MKQFFPGFLLQRLIIAFVLVYSSQTLAAPISKLKPILPQVVEPKAQKAGGKPVLTKEQERSNANARVEKQALDETAKGEFAPAIRRYSALAKAFSGTKVGGALDLRTLDLHRMSWRPGESPTTYQRALIAAQDKYKDENVLGPENKSLVQRLSGAISAMHRTLVNTLVQQAKLKSASPALRKQTLTTMDNYLERDIQSAEKDRLRTSKGEIQFLLDNHIAAAATFAALAGEAKGPQSVSFWRLAIRSQLILASWPPDAPWDGAPAGSAPARETLKGMYVNITKPGDWETVSHIGLIDLKLSHQEEAFKVFMDTLNIRSSGSHAQHAAGLMASTHLRSKAWPELETLARLMQKHGLKGLHLKESYAARDVLGTALLEGGLERYNAVDHKTAVTKLDEFVGGWRDHNRHDQAFYTLALAHHGANSYKTAVETMINFTKAYPKSKYRRDALVNGGTWALSLAWEDHVMYFLETHVREYGRDPQAVQSLETLANLYLGREHYDAASRIMELQLVNPGLSQEAKSDIARRLLDTHERYGSPKSALRIADLLLKGFATQPSIVAPALSLKARLQAAQSSAKLDTILRQLAALDASDKAVTEALSEVQFMKAEAMAKGSFDSEIYSLESKNPIGDLNAAYARYEQLRAAYETACAHAGASWCGPAMHRLARVSDQFTASVAPLEIPRTLEQSDVSAFLARKKSIVDTVNQRSLAADERSNEEAAAGSTNPDWTGAIMWQNAADWQSERVSGETGVGYTQWHSGTAN